VVWCPVLLLIAPREHEKVQGRKGLTVVYIENEKSFSGAWWIDDIQLQFRCMFADFSEVPLVVDIRGGRDGIGGKVNIKVVDDVWQIQKL
jgi:hypothetical protein